MVGNRMFIDDLHNLNKRITYLYKRFNRHVQVPVEEKAGNCGRVISLTQEKGKFLRTSGLLLYFKDWFTIAAIHKACIALKENINLKRKNNSMLSKKAKENIIKENIGNENIQLSCVAAHYLTGRQYQYMSRGSKDLVDFVLCLIDSLPKFERRKARLFFIIYDGKEHIMMSKVVDGNFSYIDKVFEIILDFSVRMSLKGAGEENELDLADWANVQSDFLVSATDVQRAAIYKNSVSESAVALGNKFNIIGSLQNDSLFQVASLLIHVCNAVLAMQDLGYPESHECQQVRLHQDVQCDHPCQKGQKDQQGPREEGHQVCVSQRKPHKGEECGLMFPNCCTEIFTMYIHWDLLDQQHRPDQWDQKDPIHRGFHVCQWDPQGLEDQVHPQYQWDQRYQGNHALPAKGRNEA
eukprot:bmy_06978T0